MIKTAFDFGYSLEEDKVDLVDMDMDEHIALDRHFLVGL